MNAFVPSRAGARPSRAWLLPLRFALREMRGGLRGFAVFVACIALGVMAIAGVGSFAASLNDGLAREGSVILGGDLAFSLIHREATPAERAFIERRGTLSAAATMRAMARSTDGGTALVELKAVDRRYPLYGSVVLEPAMPIAAALEQRDGAFGAVVETALLARLDLKPGDRIHVGQAPIEIRATLITEPDKLAGGIGFGPRLLTSEAALRATGLLQPGSLVRWHYRLRLPVAAQSNRATDRIIAEARAQMPEAGWGILTRDKASPQLERNVERFTQFLTLVGLTALLVGGVGVGNAVKGHLDRRRETIATLKSLGATGGRVFAVYLLQVLIFAGVGTSIGLMIGAALPFAAAWAFGGMMPLPIEPALQPERLALALLYGLLTAVAFAVWPLGRAHDVPVSALFRDQITAEARWPRQRYVAAAAIVVVTLAALAIGAAYDQRIAAIFVVASAAVFIALNLVAMLVMQAARRAPRVRSALTRLAIANIHRPGALTPTVVQSLGLGLALLVIVTQIDGNLHRQFMAALPDKAPSLYFVDVPSTEAEAFDELVRRRAPEAKLERVPMLRGRIVAANGVRAEDLKPTPQAAWVLQSDRGITYATELPRGSRLVAGDWWPSDVSGEPLVSLEKRIADGLGLNLGDPITVNVLGRNIVARVANLRGVDWQGLGINFVLVFSPNSFRGAPHTHIATVTYPDGGTVAAEVALLKAVADAFPTVTTVRVKEALDAVGAIVTNLALGIRGASLVTLLSAVLVLGGALAAGHRHRVYDAVILKTLGATRGRLLAAYALEYLLLGLATAVFGVAVGSIAAYFVVRDVMNLSFVWLPLPAVAAAFGALVVTVALGLIGTFTALGQKPAPVLRNL
jgi:putative ABC transport system permease protein